MTHLKKVSEQKPQATYYNVDMLKYQVSRLYGQGYLVLHYKTYILNYLILHKSTISFTITEMAVVLKTEALRNHEGTSEGNINHTHKYKVRYFVLLIIETWPKNEVENSHTQLISVGAEK